MAKLQFKFNGNTSRNWVNDDRYNALFLQSVRTYHDTILKTEHIVFVKEMVKAFGFDVKEIQPENLRHCWLSDISDYIDMVVTKPEDYDGESYLITLDTDE